MKYTDILTRILKPAIFFIAVFVLLQLSIPYQLFFREQCTLFICTPSHICNYLNQPAPLARLCADALCQLFYFRMGGALAIAAVATLAAGLWKIALRRNARLLWLMLPVGVSAVSLTDAQQPEAALTGMALASVACLALERACNMRHTWAAAGISLAVGALSAWAVGSSTLLAIAALAGAQYAGRQKWTVIGTATASGCAALLALRHIYTVPIAEVLYEPSMPAYLVATAAAFAAATALSRLNSGCAVGATVASATIIAGINISPSVERAIGLSVEYHFGNHSRVENILASIDADNRIKSYYQNLESARRGTLSDDLLTRYQPGTDALFILPSPNTPWEMMFMGAEAPIATGLYSLAQHSAMLANTFSPKRQASRAIQLLADINEAASDTMAAARYQRMLHHTPISYRSRHLRKAQCAADTILHLHDVEAMLRHAIAADTTNYIAIDYLLCHNLLRKDLRAFYQNIQTFKPQRIGRCYQEALLTCLAAAGADAAAAVQFGIEPSIAEAFARYNNAYLSVDKETLKRDFRNTYWYYYHFINPQQ